MAFDAGGRGFHAAAMRWVALLPLPFASLLLFGWPAPAAATARCTAGSAVRTTIEDIRGDFDRWRGRCVTLSGILQGRRLYADRQALLEPIGGYGERVRHSLVLYRGRQPHPSRPVRVDVTGTVSSCALEHAAVAAMQAEQPDAILMVGGYCHTSLELYVTPVRISILSRAPIARLTEAEVPPDRRSLVDATPYLANRGDQVEAARAMLRALVGGDADGYFRLADPEQAAWRAELQGQPYPSALRDRIREARRDFETRARRVGGHPALRPVPESARIFVRREDLGDDPSDGSYLPLIHCWCTLSDCAGRWPVVAMDVDNDPQRPYFCVESGRYLLGPGRGEAVTATVPQARGGFAEPRRGGAATSASGT